MWVDLSSSTTCGEGIPSGCRSPRTSAREVCLPHVFDDVGAWNLSPREFALSRPTPRVESLGKNSPAKRDGQQRHWASRDTTKVRRERTNIQDGLIRPGPRHPNWVAGRPTLTKGSPGSKLAVRVRFRHAMSRIALNSCPPKAVATTRTETHLFVTSGMCGISGTLAVSSSKVQAFPARKKNAASEADSMSLRFTAGRRLRGGA